MESENYVRIFTDSQATLQALHNPHVTSKLIEDTIAQLNQLGETVKSLGDQYLVRIRIATWPSPTQSHSIDLVRQPFFTKLDLVRQVQKYKNLGN